MCIRDRFLHHGTGAVIRDIINVSTRRNPKMCIRDSLYTFPVFLLVCLAILVSFSNYIKIESVRKEK